MAVLLFVCFVLLLLLFFAFVCVWCCLCCCLDACLEVFLVFGLYFPGNWHNFGLLRTNYKKNNNLNLEP